VPGVDGAAGRQFKVKRALWVDIPWAHAKLSELEQAGALSAEDEWRFKELLGNLYQRPTFNVGFDWMGPEEMYVGTYGGWDRDLPQALQEHILGMIEDPGLRIRLFTNKEGTRVRECERLKYRIREIRELRLVNKQFRDRLEWSINTKLEDEISPMVSSCVSQLMYDAHTISKYADEAERAERIERAIMVGTAQKSRLELYHDLGPWIGESEEERSEENQRRTATVRAAFKRNVDYQWEHLKTKVAKLVFCSVLLKFFGRDPVLHDWFREKQEYYERPPESEA